MPSDRSQILDLFAAGRIDFAQTERLLCLTSMRDRFLTGCNEIGLAFGEALAPDRNGFA